MIAYHGTVFGKQIRKEGLRPSLSGFGQRSLRGVALSPSLIDPITYAQCKRYDAEAGEIEIFIYKFCADNFADLRDQGLASSYHIWRHLGLDPMVDEDARKFICEGNDKGPFFLTDYLIELGYAGAFVDNTLSANRAYEICAFHPDSITCLGSVIWPKPVSDCTMQSTGSPSPSSRWKRN
jgi:hypothetical protein